MTRTLGEWDGDTLLSLDGARLAAEVAPERGGWKWATLGGLGAGFENTREAAVAAAESALRERGWSRPESDSAAG